MSALLIGWLNNNCAIQILPLRLYCGQAAPPAIQIFICATVSGRERGGKVRPSPGLQPQPTKSSLATWSSSWSSERPPFCFGSLICWHSSAGERPTNTILCCGDGSAHFGLPGGMCSPGRLTPWWQVSQRIAVTPWPSAPRFTFCMCTWLSSPCKGASPAGWQFWHRGEVNTR